VIPKTTRLLSWVGRIPEPGEYLRTEAGSTYLVFSRRDNRRTDPKGVAMLQLGKLERDEIDEMPGGAVIHPFAWAPRSR
jgi:hypothetical protein